VQPEYRSESFSYPLPNYDDYKFNEYIYERDQIPFPITGSKGCVRDCDFCDIRFQFGKYRYRTGHDIAKEMIHVAEHLGFRKFHFTDSLVNGGLKQLEEFCTRIAEYNLTNPDKRIIWSGQYICRPESQMPTRLYKLMADSGATGLTIGAESGSNHVLEIMNKKTTVDALYSELEQFRQHGLTCVLLTFLGHHSETYEDFVQHCKMLIKIAPYMKCGTISNITLGTPAGILQGTPGINDIEKYKIHMYDEYIWVSELNPQNKYKERLYRRLAIHKLAYILKLPNTTEYMFLRQINSYVDLKYEQINDFYKKFDETYNQ
jgi:radical SAM superfamily enzyme YgiQ (UPF0313 family)